jgi:glycosyltransferase involved in cell wall biosynthesis
MELRVAFVAYELGLGGSTTFLLNLATELERRSIRHLVIGLNANHAFKSDFDAARINTWCPSQAPSTCEDELRLGVEKLFQFKPTHIFGCLGPQSLEILRYMPANVARLGIVQTDDTPTYSSLVSYAGFLDATVGVSQHACEVLRRSPRLSKKPVYYQPHGIPTPVVHRSRLPNSPIRIIYVGRLIREQKRVHLFPRILEQLLAADRPFIWRIVGDGPELNWLRQNLASDSPEQKIVFTGGVPYRRIPELMADSDVFLLPSDYEGLPLSLLEAMANGTVPVVSDLASGIRETIRSDTGLLVNPTEIDGYASAILRLESDRNLLSEMSAAGMELARKQFSCEAMAERWLRMLSELKSAQAEWSSPSKIKPAIKMRLLGLRFLPMFRPVGDFVDTLRGWKF